MDAEVLSYQTIARNAEAVFREKGSKFLAYAFVSDSEHDAALHLEEVRKLHPKARHHCYALRFDPDHPEERFQDAGEPSGSAGLPILNQIRSADLVNCLVVVVRYFGGTKLGMSGLIKAYKEAAAGALDAAGVRSVELVETFFLEVPYEGLEVLYKQVPICHGTIEEQRIDNISRFTVTVPRRHAAAFREALQDHLTGKPDSEGPEP